MKRLLFIINMVVACCLSAQTLPLEITPSISLRERVDTVQNYLRISLKKPIFGDVYWRNGLWEINKHPWKQFSDTILSRPVPTKCPPLRDTLKQAIPLYECAKFITEEVQKDGHLTLSFESNNYSMHWHHKNYLFPRLSKYPIDKRTQFGVDWYFCFDKESRLLKSYDYSVDVLYASDTIITYNTVVDAGGVTSEGHTYRISGNQIDHIETQSIATYNLTQGISINGRDDWGIFVCRLEGELKNCRKDSLSYTLPVFNRWMIDGATFDQIRSKAIATQQRIVTTYRDSILAQETGYIKEINRKILDDFKRKLPLCPEQSQTLKELLLELEFGRVTTLITIYYKDGTRKRLVHISLFEELVP